MGEKFVDVSIPTNLKRVNWSKNSAPIWQRAGRGLCLEGICENGSCQAYEQRVVMTIGYKKFDIVAGPSESTTKCPSCLRYVEPQTCGLNNCWWRWSGIKQNSQGKAPIECSDNWTYVDNAYHYFDANESGTVIWRKLTLEAMKHI